MTQSAKATQGLRIDPGSFALAISVESIEADLDPLAEANGFHVVDRYSIFHGVAGEIGAQRQPAVGRKSPEMHNDTAAKIGANYPARVAERSAVEFAVTHHHDLSDVLHDFLSCLEGKPFKFWRGLSQFTLERDFTALD